jgi:hypothetical protein
LGIICFYMPTLYVHWTETNLSCLHWLPFDWLWHKTFRILLISCMCR